MGLPLTTDTRVSAEEFVAWYDQQPDGKRYELLDGIVHEMMTERFVHAETKFLVTAALRRQIAEKNLPCQGIIDGMAVRVDDYTTFEPVVMIRCGPRLPGNAVLVLDPMIVIEITSPSTQRIDANRKFLRYFNNPSIVHYLILDPAGPTAIHHQRMLGGRIETRGFESGVIHFDPPGIDLDLAEVKVEA